MKTFGRIIIILIIVAALGASYYLYSSGNLPSVAAATEQNVVSGFIEGDQLNVTTETGGRIEAISAKEGDRVTAGQELVQLNHALLDAQMAQAQAAVDTARAQLAQLQSTVRAEDVQQAEAALAQAVVVRDGAKRAWDNAVTAREHPQELDGRIAAAQGQVEVLKPQVDAATHAVDVAQATANAAAVRKDQYQGPAKVLPDARVATEEWAAAEDGVLSAQAMLHAAQASLDGAQKNLGLLLEMRAHPVGADALVDTAQAQYNTAAAAVDIAQARLDAVKAGPSQEQLAVAQAMVRQAEAALSVLQVQLARTTVKSPLSGIVTRSAWHVGESVTPGAGLLTIALVDPVRLTVYVPEAQIGSIKPGDAIGVQVDAFPNRWFDGVITNIASQAEFTPRNVQTKTERVNMVFAVRVQIPNAKQELKPGMPADARLP